MDGIKAKASALQLDELFADYEAHQQIALSLAEDLTALGSPVLFVRARFFGPIGASAYLL